MLLTTALSTGILFSFQSISPAAAQSAQTRSFDIPPQPLSSALRQFADQSGMQLAYRTTELQGIASPGYHGSASSTQALARLLAGTGVSYSVTAANTVTISRASTTAASALPQGAIPLDTIDVQGNDQSAYGPGVGYVATNGSTGTKTNTPIIETPQSISVVTKKQIDDQKPQSVNEALRYSAGVVAEPAGNATVNQPNNILIRGFAADTYLDGLKALGLSAANTTGVDPYLLNRIEVLNGPASVLYGQANPGGLVNLESKLPTETPIHEIILGGGNYNHYQAAFDLGGPIDKDGHFLYRLTGVGFDQGTQVDFVKNKAIEIAPALTWKPDADTSLTILGKYIDRPAVGAYVWVPARGTVLPNPNGSIPRSFFSGDPNYNTFSTETKSIGYRFEHRFDNTWSFRQNVRYTNGTIDSEELLPSSLSADGRTLTRYAFPRYLTYDSVQVDNQLSAKFDWGILHHNVTLGIDYQYNRIDQSYQLVAAGIPSINIFNPTYFITPPVVSSSSLSRQFQTTDQTGLYAQDQISIDRWRLMLGVRQDWADNSTQSTNAATKLTTSTDYFSRAPSWRTGLVYLFDNGLAPYASYITSFQPNTGTDANGASFAPTTAQQYEVGIKYQPPGWNSFVTAALYDLTEQNVLTTNPQSPSFQTQTGEVRVRGIELQGHATLTDNIDLIAAYAYSRAINTKSNTTGVTINGVTESTEGKWPVAIPAQTASLWANYTFHDGPLRGFGFGGGVRYVGSTYGDAVNSFQVPAFTLVDAAVHYDLGKANPNLKGLNLQVNVTNLFDKTYAASCISTSSCYYGLGRTIYATLKYDW